MMSNNIQVENIKKVIAYLYLLSFCPAEKVPEFTNLLSSYRESLAEKEGMTEKEFMKNAIPEACDRIIAYHEGTRQPDKNLVKNLIDASEKVDSDQKAALAFQEIFEEIYQLSGRAKPENRLHRKKGCDLCNSPCRYGYFALVSDPQISVLQRMLEEEGQKPVNEQTPFNPVWGFTLSHLASLTGLEQGFISIEHLGNLAYCLLLLATAKSRKPIPERQLQIFQDATQMLIQAGVS
jgi:hypothetical protein